VRTKPADHGLGRSRGGLSTKIHLSCEQRQKPLSIVITAGQRGDSPQFGPCLPGIAVPRLGPGQAQARSPAWIIPGTLEALIPGRMQGHGGTEEVSR